MAITYDWHFPQLQVQYTSNSLANVVTDVSWRYTGGTGSGEDHQGYSIHNETHMGSVASADFVAYESLTKDLITGWVTASLFDVHGDDYITTMQADISSSIALSMHPVEGSKATPW